MNEKDAKTQQPENPETKKEKRISDFAVFIVMFVLLCVAAVYIVHSEITKIDLRAEVATSERQAADLRQQLDTVYVAKAGLEAAETQDLSGFGPMTLIWTDQDGQELLYYCERVRVSYNLDSSEDVEWSLSFLDEYPIYPSYAETGPQVYYVMRPAEGYHDYPEIHALELCEIDNQLVKIERQYSAVADHLYFDFDPEDKDDEREYLVDDAKCTILFDSLPIGHAGAFDGDVHLTYKDVSLPEPEKCDRCACPDCCCKDCRCVAN